MPSMKEQKNEDESFLKPLSGRITEKKVRQIFQKYHAVWCRYTVKNLMEKRPVQDAFRGLERGYLDSYTVYQLECGRYIVKYDAQFFPKGDCCYDVVLEIETIFPYTDATISKLAEVFRSAYKIYHDTAPLTKNPLIGSIRSKYLDDYFLTHDRLNISQSLLVKAASEQANEGGLS